MRLFKEYTGFSPIQYKINLKIDYAKELLSSSTLSITQISELAGFENPLYFSTVFEKSTGMRPTDYRKACSTSAGDFSY